jgi:hypothetical protein
MSSIGFLSVRVSELGVCRSSARKKLEVRSRISFEVEGIFSENNRVIVSVLRVSQVSLSICVNFVSHLTMVDRVPYATIGSCLWLSVHVFQARPIWASATSEMK